MKIETTATEPMQFRVKYNGKVVFDQTFQPGTVNIDVEHPKTCGTAECFLVFGDEEMLLSAKEYGTCQCADGPHVDASESAAAK